MIPLIANPAAGGGRCGRAVDAVARRLRDAGLDIDVQRTSGPGHATELARAAVAAGAGTVLCAGGDGTAFEVVNGLLPTVGPRPPRLGMLPLGTGNSFLKDLDLHDADDAVAAVLRGRSLAVDAVHAEADEGDFHYINLLTIGFASDVGQTTNRWFKPLGAAGYGVATVIEVARLAARPIPHRLDDGPLDATPYDFVSFSNSRCTGGDMQMAPDADVTDGRLDVIRIGDLGRLGLLRTFPKIYAGAHLSHPLNTSATAAEVTFELEGPEVAMVDGEILVRRLTRLTVLPAALDVLA